MLPDRPWVSAKPLLNAMQPKVLQSRLTTSKAQMQRMVLLKQSKMPVEMPRLIKRTFPKFMKLNAFLAKLLTISVESTFWLTMQVYFAQYPSWKPLRIFGTSSLTSTSKAIFSSSKHCFPIGGKLAAARSSVFLPLPAPADFPIAQPIAPPREAL